jgi:hypothetical protein
MKVPLQMDGERFLAYDSGYVAISANLESYGIDSVV